MMLYIVIGVECISLHSHGIHMDAQYCQVVYYARSGVSLVSGRVLNTQMDKAC
jgi:hypothetical protein